MSLALSQDGAAPASDGYASAFNLAPAPMALATRAGGAVWLHQANKAFQRLFGLQRSQPRYRLERVFRGREVEQVRRAVDLCLDRGEPSALRVALARRSKRSTLDIATRRIELGEGACVLISASVAQPAVSLSSLGEAGMLAEISALSHGLVYVHDFQRAVIRCAPHPLLERIGLPAGSMPVADALSVIDPSDHQTASRFIQRQLTADDGDIIQCVFRVRACDGTILWLSVRSQILARTPQGRVQRCLSVASDETEHRQHQARIAAAERALAEAELDERRRIGRELHDSTAQLLLAARLGLGALSVRGGLAGEALRILEEARRAIDSAQQEIRNLSFALHPPALLETGLEDSLRTFAAGFARRTGLEIAVTAARGPWRLPFISKVALFRVAQEALMNIHRHARARSVEVRISGEGRRVLLEIEDDGIGLPTDFGHAAEGVGISGMRARMDQVGGEFEIVHGPAGVLVRASVKTEVRTPMAQRRPAPSLHPPRASA